jgi:SAM-dependent methyltransferase
MELVSRCNLCGSENYRLLETYELYGKVFNFVECQDCGLAFLTPRPTLEEMKAYYGNAYMSDHRVGFQEPHFLKKLYYSIQRKWLRYSCDGGVAYFCPFEVAWRWKIRRNYWFGLPRSGCFLDVGCGDGTGLGLMKQFGFECYGCEPDSYWAEIATSVEGVKISATDLCNASYPDHCFDAVRCWHVLEHVHDPMKELIEINRILKPGGVVIISSPNHDSLLKRVFQNLEDVPRHLFSFSPKTIKMYFENCGFKPMHISTGGAVWSLYSQYYHASVSYVRENAHAKEPMVEKFWKHPLRRLEYRATRNFFRKIGAGHDIFATGVKL